MKNICKLSLTLLTMATISSCSLFGIQSEEGPKYKVLVKDGNYEIRKYSPYLVAQITVEGDYNDSSGEAFRILAGYIFGKNQGENKVAMTSPVEIKKDPVKISMTSPVTMDQEEKSFTMRFSMPSKYTLYDLPRPLDKRITFKEVPSKVIAVHRYTLLGSQERNEKKAAELKLWLNNRNDYTFNPDYTYAGYNPPWTIPFLRRNEIQIELIIKESL